MIYGISTINIIIWAIFGFIIGYLVDLIDSGDVHGGLVGTILFSIMGSFIGGALFRTIMKISLIFFSVEGLLIAVVGALIFAFLNRIVFRSREHIKTTATKI